MVSKGDRVRSIVTGQWGIIKDDWDWHEDGTVLVWWGTSDSREITSRVKKSDLWVGDAEIPQHVKESPREGRKVSGVEANGNGKVDGGKLNLRVTIPRPRRSSDS